MRSKFVSEYYTIEKKAFFSLFCMAGNNSSNSPVPFETFLQKLRGIKDFKLHQWQNKSFICRKNLTEKTLVGVQVIKKQSPKCVL